MRLTTEVVELWAAKYDEEYRGSQNEKDEKELMEWLEVLPEPKHLDLEHFVQLGRWKTPRQLRAYESNDEDLVVEATRMAYETSNELLELHILRVLKGVEVAVASTILYFLHPDRFPIFDIRARKSLKKAGQWVRDVDDASDRAWYDYVLVMRRLSDQFSVSLRDLDKALFAYDKWGSEEAA